MFSLPALPYKLIGMAVGALAVLAFVLMAFHWKGQASDRKDQLSAICAVTREAAANPKLDCKQVPQQIRLLGKAVLDLKLAIIEQIAAVDALGAKSKADQIAAAQASQAAQARARGAEATAERLRASARSGVAPSASCKPSRVVEEMWK